MIRLIRMMVLGVALGVTAGCGDQAAEETPRIKPRTDFGPEEFGIGKAHTPNRGCNREIDTLLEELRRCYNSRGDEACRPLHRDLNERIARLKNSVRCRR